MPVFRVPKTANYTVMSNHHLRNPRLSLKAKGLLSYMLSNPDDWDYSLQGLASQSRDGVDSIRTALSELEAAGYLRRRQERDARGRIVDLTYEIYEEPCAETSYPENPDVDEPALAEPGQPNTEEQNTEEVNTEPTNQPGTRERFREQLEYDILERRCDPALLGEVLENIVEMYDCPREQQHISRQMQSTRAVQERLDMLRSEHIQYALEVMAKPARPVKNVKAYLRAVLLNAPMTMEHYYEAEVDRLLAGG